MSTKISALDERLQQDINGEEFFPIIDSTPGGYHTYKINLDQLFQSGQGYEKVTSLSVTNGATVASNNTSFTLEYTQEDNTIQTLTIEKYKIQDNDVAFSHIDPAGYITSTQRISLNNVDNKLATAKAVDDHIDYREALYDVEIKKYIGDDDNGVLADFATLTNVANDFTNLLDGVKPELNTFKKIEQQFDTIDYSDKIGTSQVNIAHFRINENNLNTRLNIKDSAITANLISANAVTSDKIQNGSVLRSKIANGAISNDKISDATITASKIKDGTLTPDKLSSGAPYWDNTRVNIPSNLNVQHVYANGNFNSKGTDFRLYNASRAGTNVHYGRALVHNVGDRLDINYANDYTGGVNIRGVVTVPDQDAAAINAGGNRSVATKEYVDAADILTNPIAGDRIQDNAIALRHMSDNSVGTLEILNDSITSEKIENIGPQWNSSGDVVVSGKLTANGQTFTLGSNALPSGNVTLSLKSSGSGSTSIIRTAGSNGSLSINNTGGGSINFSPGSSTKFQVSSSKSTFSNPLHITGAGSSTIAGTNFTNPALLIGSSEYGIAIDPNEIIQKGHHLILGVSNGASQNIFFKDGVNTLAAIFGNSGNFSIKGAIISESGTIRRNGETSHLALLGGTAHNNGANIELYGKSNASHPGYAYYDADKHSFRSMDASVTALTIDSKAKKVTLHGEGTSANHLVTKGYVDKNTFPKITTLDNITTRMDSGFYQTSSATIAEGWPEDRGWYHLLTTTHSNTNNYYALQFAASYFSQEVYFRSTHDKGDREWSRLWHTNNDGSGSGLDADLLDGKEATAFSLVGHKHDDLYRKLNTKIGVNDLTTGAPTWNSTNVVIPNQLNVTGYTTIKSGLSVGGQIRSTGPDFYLYNTTRAGGNTHPGRALVHNSGDKLTINYGKDYTGGVEISGTVIAPNQTTTIINSNNKALTTKEYVASEIAKVYPDNNYILKSAPEKSSQSMTSALIIEGTVDAQVAETSNSTYRENGVNLLLRGSSTGVSGIFFQSEKNGQNINHPSDFGYIQYHSHGIGNTSGEQSDLVIGVSNDPSGSIHVDKVVIDVPGNDNFVLTSGGSTEYKIWHDGNTNNAVDTSKIVNYAVTSAKIASNAVTTAKIASNAVTTANIANSSVTLDKLANITSGFVLGKTNNDTKLVPIDTNLSIGTSHNVIASGQAAKDYTDLKVRGLATTAYVDAKIAAAKGTVHYIDMYGLGRTPVNNNPSESQVTWAKGQLGSSVRSGDYVMARVRYYESYGWGNGTAYRDRNRLYIYRVSGAYPNSVWTIYNSWYA